MYGKVSQKKQLIFGIILLVIILGVVEAAANVWLYELYRCDFEDDDYYTELDDETKRQLCIENIEIQYFDTGTISHERLELVTINQYGFRGDNFPIEKPENTYRIFVLGGSTTFGSIGELDNQTWPYYLQEKINNESFAFKVEIINAGVGSGDSFTETKLIKSKILNFQPDMVIVYDGINDAAQHGGTPPEIWKENWVELCEIGKVFGFKTIITVQPLLGTGNEFFSDKEHTRFLEFKKEQDRWLEFLEHYAQELNELNQHCAKAVDLRDLFSGSDKPIYIDRTHVYPFANEIVAERFLQLIIPELYLDEDKFTLSKEIKNYNIEDSSPESVDILRKIIGGYKTPRVLLSLIGNQFSYSNDLGTNIFFNQDLSNKNFVNQNLQFSKFYKVNLVDANFQGANLMDASFLLSNLNGTNFENANLSGAELSGIDLRNTILSGADLSGADLMRTNLSEKNLSNVIIDGVDFSNADLSGANLSGKDLSTVNLKYSILIDTNLSGSKLPKMDLRGNDLSGANLSKADLSGQDLRGIKLVGADLSYSNLFGVRLGELPSVTGAAETLKHKTLNFLKNTDYTSDLSYANLRGANIEKAYLANVNLSHADLTDVDISLISLTGVNLSGVDLSNKDLTGVSLLGADLSGANLSGADLTISNLQYTNLKNADFSGTKFGNLTTLFNIKDEIPINSSDEELITQFYVKLPDLRQLEAQAYVDRSSDIIIFILMSDLRGADLTGANFANSNLEDARFDGAILDCINHPICN